MARQPCLVQKQMLKIHGSELAQNNQMPNLIEKIGSMAKNEVTKVEALLPEVKAKLICLKDMKVETKAELYQMGGKGSG